MQTVLQHGSSRAPFRRASSINSIVLRRSGMLIIRPRCPPRSPLLFFAAPKGLRFRLKPFPFSSGPAPNSVSVCGRTSVQSLDVDWFLDLSRLRFHTPYSITTQLPPLSGPTRPSRPWEFKGKHSIKKSADHTYMEEALGRWIEPLTNRFILFMSNLDIFWGSQPHQNWQHKRIILPK